MYQYKIVEQVKRKPKKMTKLLKVIIVVFAVFFVLLGIVVSQGFMLPGFLMVLLYFIYDVFSQKEYEYTLEDDQLMIDVIVGKRYRRTAHELDLKDLEVVAPNLHNAVAKYRKNAGGIKLRKYDYTSYEEDIPYYTMIIMENREKIKILLDLSDNMLREMKRKYPQKVFFG